MKKRISLAVCVTALSLAFSGCINDKFGRTAGNDPIRFATSIGEKTRASGTVWGENDAIGAYMISEDGAIAGNSLAENVKHTHTGEGKFAADEGDALYYPAGGDAVDFVAYYPHMESFDGHGYPIDVSDQSDPAAIDFMYSDNAAGYSTGTPFLQFHHKLVKLIFNVTDGDGASLEEFTATITGMKTAGVYDLSEGAFTPTEDSEGNIDPVLISAEGATASMEAIVLPDTGIDPEVAFTLADGATAVLALTGVTYLEGKAYTYNITVSSAAEAVTIGGSEIVDWAPGWDEGDTSGDHAIEKKPAGNGGDGEVTEYYLEAFGDDEDYIEPPILIGDFTGWSSGHPGVAYTDSGATQVSIRSIKETPHMFFLDNVTNDVTITGLPAGYTDIVLSIDLGGRSNGIVNPLRIYAGVTEVTPSPAATLYSTSYSTLSIPLPDGTTSIRLYAPLSTGNTLFIDNIRLEGRK